MDAAQSSGVPLRSRMLRPGFGLFLFLSQFTATRGTLFTPNAYLLVLGGALLLAGIWLSVSASRHLQLAREQDVIARTGPYRYIRHPIYASICVISSGLGCLFFAWAWFGVLLAFMPLWILECRDEERHLTSLHGEMYAAYQRSTGMMFPRSGRLR
jgi:protein-S-isoprenylcysteine O-methyltransferase Ste14